MTEELFLNTITSENLPVNFFNEHELKPFEVVLEKKNDSYQVFCTNERAGLQGVTSKFDNKEEAFSNVLKKARLMKKNYH